MTASQGGGERHQACGTHEGGWWCVYLGKEAGPRSSVTYGFQVERALSPDSADFR